MRLCLRKEGKLHNSVDLQNKYGPELGPKLHSAINQLCKEEQDYHPHHALVKIEEDAVELHSLEFVDYRSFAFDGTSTDLSELLSCLKAEQLKSLAKDMKIPSASRTVRVLPVVESSSSEVMLGGRIAPTTAEACFNPVNVTTRCWSAKTAHPEL